MFTSYKGVYYNIQQIVSAKKDIEYYRDADEYVERVILELRFSDGSVVVVKDAETIEKFILLINLA